MLRLQLIQNEGGLDFRLIAGFLFSVFSLIYPHFIGSISLLTFAFLQVRYYSLLIIVKLDNLVLHYNISIPRLDIDFGCEDKTFTAI